MQYSDNAVMITLGRNQLHKLMEHIQYALLLRKQINRNDQSEQQIRHCRQYGSGGGKSCSKHCRNLDLSVQEIRDVCICGIPVNVKFSQLLHDKIRGMPCNQLFFCNLPELILTAGYLFDQHIDCCGHLRDDQENDHRKQNDKDQHRADSTQHRRELAFKRMF